MVKETDSCYKQIEKKLEHRQFWMLEDEETEYRIIGLSKKNRRVVEIIEKKYRFSINSGSIDNPSSPNSAILSSECLLGLFSYIRTSKFSNFLANTL